MMNKKCGRKTKRRGVNARTRRKRKRKRNPRTIRGGGSSWGKPSVALTHDTIEELPINRGNHIIAALINIQIIQIILPYLLINKHRQGYTNLRKTILTEEINEKLAELSENNFNDEDQMYNIKEKYRKIIEKLNNISDFNIFDEGNKSLANSKLIKNVGINMSKDVKEKIFLKLFEISKGKHILSNNELLNDLDKLENDMIMNESAGAGAGAGAAAGPVPAAGADAGAAAGVPAAAPPPAVAAADAAAAAAKAEEEAAEAKAKREAAAAAAAAAAAKAEEEAAAAAAAKAEEEAAAAAAAKAEEEAAAAAAAAAAKAEEEAAAAAAAAAAKAEEEAAAPAAAEKAEREAAAAAKAEEEAAAAAAAAKAEEEAAAAAAAA